MTELSVNERLTRIETKLDRAILDISAQNNNYATKQECIDVAKRVEKLEETNSWIVKTVFGIIITAIMAIVFSLGK